MERNVSVNAGEANLNPLDSEDVFLEPEPEIEPVRLPSASGGGPCLYLGPAGQRCSARAIDGFFCARHRPAGRRPLTPGQLSRRAGAAVGVAAVLWPILDDLIREILRLLR